MVLCVKYYCHEKNNLFFCFSGNLYQDSIFSRNIFHGKIFLGNRRGRPCGQCTRLQGHGGCLVQNRTRHKLNGQFPGKLHPHKNRAVSETSRKRYPLRSGASYLSRRLHGKLDRDRIRNPLVKT